MRKLLSMVLVLLLTSFVLTVPRCGKVYAETQVTVDLEQLPEDARNAILDSQKRAQEAQQAQERPLEDRMAKWLDIGVVWEQLSLRWVALLT